MSSKHNSTLSIHTPICFILFLVFLDGISTSFFPVEKRRLGLIKLTSIHFSFTFCGLHCSYIPEITHLQPHMSTNENFINRHRITFFLSHDCNATSSQKVPFKDKATWLSASYSVDVIHLISISFFFSSGIFLVLSNFFCCLSSC